MLKIGDFSKLSRVSIRMLRHLRCKQAELQALSEETAYRLRLLETAQTRLRKEDKTMKYDVTIKIFPARYSATVRMVIPPYEQMGGINEAVAAWVSDNGYVFDGPMFNIYHVSPHETSNPDEYVTEVCCPVKKA